MSFQAAIHGRLGGDPREITTKTVTPMAVATVAVTLETRGEEQETEWLGLVAFGKLAERLLRHRKGDMLSTAGKVQLNTWTTDGGQRMHPARRAYELGHMGNRIETNAERVRPTDGTTHRVTQYVQQVHP